MKKIVLLFCLILSANLLSQQKSINDYKYILVPTEYEFLSSPDQYQLNSLTKFLFNKNGFLVFFVNEELPKDLQDNGCSALTVDIKNNSGLLTTKNVIELKDCRGNIVFKSKEGRSRLKQYKRAFQEAVKDAFKSIKALKYKYNGKNQDEIKVVKSEPTKTNNDIKVIEEVKEPIKVTTPTNKNVLYAQEILNGFQLVNTKPEVIFQILKTSKKNYFFLKNKTGILYKQDKVWVAEFYEKDKLIQKEYQVKF